MSKNNIICDAHFHDVHSPLSSFGLAHGHLGNISCDSGDPLAPQKAAKSRRFGDPEAQFSDRTFRIFHINLPELWKGRKVISDGRMTAYAKAASSQRMRLHCSALAGLAFQFPNWRSWNGWGLSPERINWG